MKFLFLLIAGIIAYLFLTGKLQKFLGGAKPEGMSKDQARALLGVDRASNSDAIIRAHRDMMIKYHPDKGGNAEIARQINEARDVLLEQQLKKDLT